MQKKSPVLKLILASQSPRRKEILESAGIRCTIVSSNSSESFDENLTLDENLRAVVADKIKGSLGNLSRSNQKRILILAADTVVVIGKEVLGKPRNSGDAKRMLLQLSGKTHIVKTAFGLFNPDESRVVTRIVTTHVTFRKLSLDEIKWYILSQEPFDKAGSYAIQGLGGGFVTLVKGDLQNVVGLPLNAVEREFRKQRWNVGVKRKITSRSTKNRKR
jgi:septum formation protein